jgi:Peptidase family M1 domain
MENYGLVTYREVYLLFDPLKSTTRNWEDVILTIAHEFVVSNYSITFKHWDYIYKLSSINGSEILFVHSGGRIWYKIFIFLFHSL